MSLKKLATDIMKMEEICTYVLVFIDYFLRVIKLKITKKKQINKKKSLIS